LHNIKLDNYRLPVKISGLTVLEIALRPNVKMVICNINALSVGGVIHMT